MNTLLIPLSSVKHRSQGWLRQSGYGFAAHDTLVPLTKAEVPQALPYYPLAFARTTPMSYVLVAIQGLAPKANVYVNGQSQWLAPYVPAHYRAYPFALVKVHDGEERKRVLCFNNASGLLRETPDPRQGEQRFFDDQGQAQPWVQEILAFLHHLHAARDQTQTAVQAIAAAGLLQAMPWPPQAAKPSQEPATPVQGLYRINEAALQQLDVHQLQALHQAQALPLVYAQLHSLPQVSVVQRLAQIQQRQAQKQADAPTQPIDLGAVSQIFDGMPSDTLKFNW